jgi:hypothetical protein
MLLVNELLFAYFSIGPSSKFNLWDYCYDDIQQRIPYSHHCPSWYFASKLDFSEIDPPHQGGGPKPVNFKKFIIIRISRFWWWMRSGSDVSLRTAVR